MSKLYKEILDTINSKIVVGNRGTGDVYAAKEIEKIAIRAQIETLQQTFQAPENLVTDYLYLKIEELQKQLEQK